jgi:TRAP-type mannitol/chloroaromatic compound transport system permease large subunit
MLKAGYSTRLAAGAVTAGGTLGILIPPSVLLILYGATAGVSVMQLYAGAFFPGIMLAGLYVVTIIIYAKLKPSAAPPLSEEDRRVELPKFAEDLARDGGNAVAGLTGALVGGRNADVPRPILLRQLGISLLPALAAVLVMGSIYLGVTAPKEVVAEGVVAMGFAATEEQAPADAGGLQEPEVAGGLQEPEVAGGVQEPEGAGGVQEPPGAVSEAAPAETSKEAVPAAGAAPDKAPQPRVPAPMWFWIVLGLCLASVAIFYMIFDFARLEVFKMLLTSFFPLALLIAGVLGSIIAGLATPTEAAAMGSFGALLLTIAYGQFNMRVLKESVFLTARTSAMVCWLFVGSGIFAAAFALLGGQEIVNSWVTSLDLSAFQFMLLAQVIIFLLGWPLEWTEIIVIFMPIFLPLLTHFNVDPLFFGLLVALNLQTAFLSPPVAMAAFYLKGVAPAHVTLNQIFLGMMPFMVLQVLAIVLLYIFPQIGMWLPSLVYGH